MRCRRRRWAGRQRYRISADADLAGPQGGEAEHEDHPLVEDLRERRSGVVLVTGMLPREDVRQVLTHATVFCCPSIYEPQGIVNLEAMACQTPVVASDVGGIPHVVTDARPDCSSTTTRPTPPATSRTWPHPSTTWSTTPPWHRPWAGPGDIERTRTSPGATLRPERPSSTTSCTDEQRRIHPDIAPSAGDRGGGQPARPGGSGVLSALRTGFPHLEPCVTVGAQDAAGQSAVGGDQEAGLAARALGDAAVAAGRHGVAQLPRPVDCHESLPSAPPSGRHRQTDAAGGALTLWPQTPATHGTREKITQRGTCRDHGTRSGTVTRLLCRPCGAAWIGRWLYCVSMLVPARARARCQAHNAGALKSVPVT